MPSALLHQSGSSRPLFKMNSSVQKQTAAALHEEELKQKLELFRSASKPQKSILKPSGNMPVAPAVSKKDIFTRPDGKALLAQPITPKFKAPHSTALKSCGRCTQPSTVAAESRCHLETILQKVLTTANSLANTGNILEVMLKSAPAYTQLSPSVGRTGRGQRDKLHPEGRGAKRYYCCANFLQT